MEKWFDWLRSLPAIGAIQKLRKLRNTYIIRFFPAVEKIHIYSRVRMRILLARFLLVAFDQQRFLFAIHRPSATMHVDPHLRRYPFYMRCTFDLIFNINWYFSSITRTWTKVCVANFGEWNHYPAHSSPSWFIYLSSSSFIKMMTLGDSSRTKFPPTCASLVVADGNELILVVLRCFLLGFDLHGLRKEMFSMS